jgi:hypothetical protein
MKIGSRSSPGAEQRKADERIRDIIEFWSQLYACGDPGATTWDVLDRLQLDVTEAQYQQPPDLPSTCGARCPSGPESIRPGMHLGLAIGRAWTCRCGLH